MARKPRIQFPGAIYHILNRGNFRKDLFSVGGSGAAFEKALFEAVKRCRWRLYSYVVMRNHFHLAVETPEGNLIEGMQWLQGTYANRFNRFTGENGHVFQGRYKAILVEPGHHLLCVINYIHLNPVRAGICSINELENFGLSSFPKYFSRKVPEALDRKSMLALSGLPDSTRGMKHYWESLWMQEEADASKRAALGKKYCRGWALASREYKEVLKEEFSKMTIAKDWGGRELRELNESTWELIVAEGLDQENKSEEDIGADPKGAPWKIRIAVRLRLESAASNPWIAQRLNMGHPTRVSNSVSKRLKL